MSVNQDRINQLAQQFNDAFTSVEARIQGLENQPAAPEEPLDWAPLEAALARIQGDEPANPPAASAPEPGEHLVVEESVSPLG